MSRPISEAGGARLERGNFEVYVNRPTGRCYMPDSPLKEHIREYWNFLMSDYESAKIGPRTARKGKSAKGYTTVQFPFLGSTVKMFKIKDGFATYVHELPYLNAKTEEEMSNEMASVEDEGYGEQVDQGTEY